MIRDYGLDQVIVCTDAGLASKEYIMGIHGDILHYNPTYIARSQKLCYAHNMESSPDRSWIKGFRPVPHSSGLERIKRKVETKETKRKVETKKTKRRPSSSRQAAGSPAQDRDKSIAYQNKDIVSKLFGDRMKGKPLSLFGLGSDLKVVDVRPTNIPIVRARELRMDNLFELEDGSVAILDYESTCKEEARQTAVNMLQSGRFSVEEIKGFIPSLSLDAIEQIAESMGS